MNTHHKEYFILLLLSVLGHFPFKNIYLLHISIIFEAVETVFHCVSSVSGCLLLLLKYSNYMYVLPCKTPFIFFTSFSLYTHIPYHTHTHASSFYKNKKKRKAQ